MFKKGRNLLKELGTDGFQVNAPISKELEEENYYSNKINSNYYIDSSNKKSLENNNYNYYTTAQLKNQIQPQAPSELKRNYLINQNQNQNDINKKIVQKDMLLDNLISSNSPNRNQNFQTNSVNSNYYTNNPNNNHNITNNDNRIKNIPISLKRVNQRSNSKNSKSPRSNTEPYMHKSPYQKRKSSNNKINNVKENDNINMYNNLNVYAQMNQSPRKQNLIPKPNQKYINNNNNVMMGNKKIDKSLLNQSKEIKKQFEQEKEIEILRQKNEYFIKRGILLEKRIDFEGFSIKLQSYFRGYLTRKKLNSLIINCIRIKNGISLLQKIYTYKKYNIFYIIKRYNKNLYASNNLRSRPVNNQISIQNNNLMNKLKEIENHFKNTNIDNINRIIINIPKKDNKIDNNLLNQRKYILKYIFLKKVVNLNKILKITFEKYKSNSIKQMTKNKEEKIEKKSDSIPNIEDLKIKKLRDIVRKKIYKHKEVLHRVLIKYYYSALYIHLNWYLYVVNQLSAYTQGLNYSSTFTGSTNTFNNTPMRESIQPVNNDNNNQHNAEVNSAFRQSVRAINKMNDNNNNPDDALRESIMSINKINDALSNEANEKKKLERKKHLKDLVTKRLKEVKNDFHKMFTKFYYQGKLLEKSQSQNNETQICISGESNDNNIQTNDAPIKLRGKRKENPALDRRNKARNLRKLMMKKEKEKVETMRKFFYKFHTNGMLFALKKNAKRSYSTKNFPIIFEDIHEIENPKEKVEKELTFIDKKILEKQKEKEELQKKRIEAMKSIFYKTDRQITLIKRKIIEKWNLRAKIMSLSKISSEINLRKSEKKKKKLKKSCRVKKEKENKNENKTEITENN